MTQQPFWSSRTGAAVRLSLHLGYASSFAPPAARRATSSRGGRPTQDFRAPKGQAKPFIHVNGAKTIKMKMRAGSMFPLLGDAEPRGANQRGAAGEHVTGWRGSPIFLPETRDGGWAGSNDCAVAGAGGGLAKTRQKAFRFWVVFFPLAFLDRRSINRLIIGLVVVGEFACCCCWPPPPRRIASYLSCLHLPYMHITPPPTINPPDPRPSRTRRPP